HGGRRSGGGTADRLLVGGWGLAVALCRDGHSVAGRVAPLLGLVPAPAAAQPVPGVLLPLPGGWRTRYVLVRADRQCVPANGSFWHVRLPGGLSYADLPDASRRHCASPRCGRGGCHPGGRCGWVGRRPALPPGLARRGMLGEGLRPAPTQCRHG